MTLRLCLFLLLTICGRQTMRAQLIDDVMQHAPMASVFMMKACGYDSRSSWQGLALSAGASYVIATATTYSLKQVVSERRPDHSDFRSFPSGHATYAFAGATMLNHEYGHLSPWVSIGGYGVATLVAVDRVRRDRHYLHDVCAGAAIGFASTELTYYLRKKLIKNKNVDLTFTGCSFDLSYRW